jgi:hypothetical protein
MAKLFYAAPQHQQFCAHLLPANMPDTQDA